MGRHAHDRPMARGGRPAEGGGGIWRLGIVCGRGARILDMLDVRPSRRKHAMRLAVDGPVAADWKPAERAALRKLRGMHVDLDTGQSQLYGYGQIKSGMAGHGEACGSRIDGEGSQRWLGCVGKLSRPVPRYVPSPST